MIFVLGNICRDTTFFVARMPVAGETVNAVRTETGLGGKGLNQAIAAHRCGSQVTLIAGTGDDWGAADEALANMGDEPGLGFSLVRRPGPSDRSSIIVAPTGENLIVTDATQAERLSIADVAPFLSLRAGDALLLQCNLQPDVTRFAAETARRVGARTVFNPAPYEDWARSLAGVVDVLILNEPEARSWTGRQDPEDAIRHLDVPLAIVTLGGEGCLIRRKGETSRKFHAPAASAVDTTAAGDTFVGVFASEWLAGHDHEHAVRLALAAASASVESTGAAASVPDRHRIDRLRSALA